MWMGLFVGITAFAASIGGWVWLGEWGWAVSVPLLVTAFGLGRHTQPVLPVEVKPDLLDMVALPGGSFWMGSDDQDDMARDNEKPRHHVSVSAFAMAKFPITRQLYRDMMTATPSEWQTDEQDGLLPATQISWFDAIDFCIALSEQQGLQPCYHKQEDKVTCDWAADGYRLPTESEWEYAVRANNDTRWFFGDTPEVADQYAWFKENADGCVHPVGEKEPNPFQLYDLIGNVWEWCWDWHGNYSPKAVPNPTGRPTGNARVLRGGSFWNSALVLRSANQGFDQPENRRSDIGFRCVRVPRRQS